MYAGCTKSKCRLHTRVANVLWWLLGKFKCFSKKMEFEIQMSRLLQVKMEEH